MKVLITGGTGSLGKALLRRMSYNDNIEVVIFSRDETKQGQVRSQYPQHTFILGDVAKYRDVQRAMQDIDVVFHLAAYKQVPSAQNNVAATVETNIIGSQNVVDAAIEAGVKKVVASSTDKACAPVNAYGASKSIMESLFQNGNKFNKTSFHLARYGNVVCSNASVIPLFQRQAAAGGPLTVTHKDMTRFWITLDMAVSLLLQALKSPPGTIVVPKAGMLSITDVARLIGPGLDIKEVGIRPGEKIHEAMVNEAESFYTENMGRYYLIHPPTCGKVYSETPFSYTSDRAPRISDNKFLRMVEQAS